MSLLDILGIVKVVQRRSNISVLQVINFKLGCFADMQVVVGIHAQQYLAALKTCLIFCPVIFYLLMPTRKIQTNTFFILMSMCVCVCVIHSYLHTEFRVLSYEL